MLRMRFEPRVDDFLDAVMGFEKRRHRKGILLVTAHPQHALARQQMDNFSGMIGFRTAEAKQTATRMMQELEVIHYAVSLGHHRSLVYLMQTDDLIGSSYRLEGDELDRYRDSAGEGIFRLSVGLEDAGDLIADLERVLD